MTKSPPKVLIYSPSVNGGIAEHTYYQGNALTKAGASVLCLVPHSFLGGRRTDFDQDVCLPYPFADGLSGVRKKLLMAWKIIAGQMMLTMKIIKHRPDLVLLDSYVEYLSPIWVWPHWFLSKVFQVRYGANLHDAVRNYVLGPRWWHRLSVRLAYLPLDFVLIHHKLPDPSQVPAGVAVVEVPVGVYEISGLPQNADEVRAGWGVTPGQKVFLSFGYVRDQKNLDLAIRALVDVPDGVLVIAGSVASNNDKPFSFYHDLAEQLGVGSRCKFFEGFVADEDLGRYFAAADFVLLTYSATFHSQSGVLNIAAKARKPVVVSAAPGPMIQLVRNYSLGVAVLPDSLEAVVQGMRMLITNPPSPCWDDYELSASWDQNALGILQAAEMAHG